MMAAAIGTAAVAAAASTNSSASAAARTAAAAGEKGNAPKKALTPAEREAARLAFRERMLRRTGGFVPRPHAPGAKFSFVNMQSAVPSADLSRTAEMIARILRHDVCLDAAPSSASSFAIASAPALVKALGAKGAVFLVDDPALPTLLAAPESGWGVVNVRALAADSPVALLLAQRVRREMWRAFAHVNGAANTSMGKCVLRTVLSLGDLDALGAEAFCPEAVNPVIDHLNRLGVKEYLTATYRQACVEGWAPPPTNDIQRAIWEKARSEKERGPSKALRIVP